MSFTLVQWNVPQIVEKLLTVFCIVMSATGIACGAYARLAVKRIDTEPRIVGQDRIAGEQPCAGGSLQPRVAHEAVGILVDIKLYMRLAHGLNAFKMGAENVLYLLDLVKII